MRTTACLSVLSLFLVLASTATSTPASTPRVAVGENACAFSRSGRLLGCLRDASSCLNLTYWTHRLWLYAHEGNGPEPQVGAKRLRAGIWSVVDFPERDREGRVVATDAAYTRWRIQNERGATVATARGRDGPLMAIVILGWGPDSFC